MINSKKPHPNFIDRTNQRYGRLLVVSRAENNKRKGTKWNCLCSCGKECIVSGHNLNRGTQSCGCLHKEKFTTKTHGMRYTYIYSIWNKTKARAKKENVLFTLTLEYMMSLSFPDICPVLGIPIMKATEFANDNSPSIDKIIPELGYIPGNVQIISFRANTIKSNGTAEEHMKIAKYIENYTKKEVQIHE